jgi:hypothetical protein
MIIRAYRLGLLVALLLTGTEQPPTLLAQDVCTPPSAAFVASVNAVLRDPTNRWRGLYPPTPALSCEVLRGLEHELADPPTRAQFERLSPARWPDTAGYHDAIAQLGHRGHVHTLLALTTHFDPDVRVLSVQQHQAWIRMRPLICALQSVYDRLAAEDRRALRFYLHTLAATPRFQAGRENATIHGTYLYELARALDLLTHESLVSAAPFDGPAYWTEARYEAAMQRWRSHVTAD